MYMIPYSTRNTRSGSSLMDLSERSFDLCI